MSTETIFGWDESDLISKYMAEVRQYPLLTYEQEILLGATVQNGLSCRPDIEGDLSLEGVGYPTPDSLAETLANAAEAQDILIKSNLRLVIYFARRFLAMGVILPNGLSFLDMIQQGNEGLIKAAQRYDPSRGTRFSTFAKWHIKNEIRKLFPKDLSIESGDSIESSGRDIEMFSAFNDPEFERLLSDGETDEEKTEENRTEVRNQAVAMALDRLSEKQRTVITMRYMDGPQTLDQIAQTLDSNMAAVSMLQTRAFKNLKKDEALQQVAGVKQAG